MGYFKTGILMVGLVLIFMFVGNALGGVEGMKIAFFAACGMNFFSYFFSDSLVLKHYQAKEVNNNNAPQLYQIVQRLANNAKLPMPKVYVVPEDVPNAFATGRNPAHAAVAVTQGLLKILSPQEIEGVLAHEMSHVRHHDILISSVAAVFAGAIAMLGQVAQRGAATNNQQSNGRNSSGGGLGLILSTVLMPIAASIVQMSISRTREFAADEGAARLTKHPEWLMAALSKLEEYAKQYRLQKATSQTAHMFIINPFSGVKQNFSSLFSTHPSTEDRLKRLAALQREIQG